MIDNMHDFSVRDFTKWWYSLEEKYQPSYLLGKLDGTFVLVYLLCKKGFCTLEDIKEACFESDTEMSLREQEERLREMFTLGQSNKRIEGIRPAMVGEDVPAAEPIFGPREGEGIPNE